MKSRRTSRNQAEAPTGLNYLRNSSAAPHPGLSPSPPADVLMSAEMNGSGSLDLQHASVSRGRVNTHSQHSNPSPSPSRTPLSLADLGRLTIDEESVHSASLFICSISDRRIILSGRGTYIVSPPSSEEDSSGSDDDLLPETLSAPSAGASPSPAALFSLSSPLLRDLLSTYFVHIHPCMPFIDKPYFLHRLAEASSAPGPAKVPTTGTLESLAWIMCALACRVKHVSQLDAQEGEDGEKRTTDLVQHDWTGFARRYWKRAKRAIDLEPRPGIMTGGCSGTLCLALFRLFCLTIYFHSPNSASEDPRSEILGRSQSEELLDSALPQPRACREECRDGFDRPTERVQGYQRAAGCYESMANE
jgi:hypothetical protein